MRFPNFSNTFSALALLVGFMLATSAAAQVTFSTPGATDITLNNCDDYFRTEWGTELDMSESQHGPLFDIPAQQNRGTTPYLYANGLLSFTANTNSPMLMFLQSTPRDPSTGAVGAIPVGTRYGQARPIDTSKYRYLVMRIHSDTDTIGQLLWSESVFRYAITNVPIYAGWHVYSIDLNNAVIATSVGSNVGWTADNWEGLEFYPSNASGVAFQFDYVQLKASTCPTQSLSFNATTQGDNNRFSLIVDNDTDPTNGVISRENLPTNGAGSSTVARNLFAPGSYRVYGLQSGDWHTLETGTPYDMSSSSQIISTLTSGISNPTFSSGIFSGTTTNADPSFYLKLPAGKKIPAGTYNKISIGISYTFGGGINSNYLDIFYQPEGSASLVGPVRIFGTTSGSQVLTISDMAALSPSWTGNISAIRIDPVNDFGVGTTFALDFVSFHSSNTVSSVSTPSIQAATGSINVTDLGLSFVQPDERGGRDYAQTVLGNPWLMDDTGDIAALANVTSAEILPHAGLVDARGNSQEGDFFRAYSITGNGDPAYPNILFIPSNRLNPLTFVNACFKGWNNTEVANGFNSVARFIWHDAAGTGTGPDNGFRDGDDVILRRENHEYCLDLKTGIPLEPALADGAPNPWTVIGENGSSVDVIRVDMSEAEEAGQFSVLDSLTIRSDHEANTRYAIVVDAPLTDSVALYYNTTKSTTGGTLITTLSGARNSNVYLWDTTAITNQTYYIYGVVSRSGDSLSRLAPGRLIINHAFTQDTTAPVLECERPGASSTFDTYLEIAGYALDETRIAALELFVDGTWVQNVARNKYHLAARQSYPNYADANTPGFQLSLDTTGYSSGAHTVQLVATDTAGNQTSCSRSVTKAAGQNTALLAYPTPSNLSVAIPTPTPAATVTAAPTATTPAVPQLKVAVSKNTVTLTASSLSGCSSFSVSGASLATFAAPMTLGTFTNTTSSFILDAKKMVSFKVRGKKSDKNNGMLHLRVTCGGVNSTAQKLDLTKVKTSTRVSTEAAALKTFKKLLKKR